MTSERLSATLSQIRNSGGAAPKEAWDLTELMIQPAYLGHHDPNLRDDLIYVTLSHWITDGLFTRDQLRQIVATVTDEEHLFYRFGSRNDNTVLIRSFSVLLIPPVLAQHRLQTVLEPPEVRALATLLERYLLGERDLRGFNVELGWLHAVAHVTDAIGSLARCTEADGASACNG